MYVCTVLHFTTFYFLALCANLFVLFQASVQTRGWCWCAWVGKQTILNYSRSHTICTYNAQLFTGQCLSDVCFIWMMSLFDKNIFTKLSWPHRMQFHWEVKLLFLSFFLPNVLDIVFVCWSAFLVNKGTPENPLLILLLYYTCMEWVI